MELNILEMVLGQIPEAIYFSLFMIFTKNIKEKRLLYTFLMIAGYIILKMFIHYNIWFQILYTCFAYTTIKILYRNKTQIIDVFILTLSIIIYGGWRRCVSWTTSLLLSMFLASKMGLLIGILFTIFSVFVISTKGNINDLTLGYKKKREEGKYYDIEEYIKYNMTNTSLIEFEENLKRADDLLYLIYKYRFRDNLTFSKISEKLNGMETARIVEKLDQIALAIRIHCGI